VSLALLVTLERDPSQMTAEQLWGSAPYDAELLYFAERCISGGGPIPQRCEQGGVWLEGKHAVALLATPEPSVEQVALAGTRRSSGLTYVRRLVMATRAGEGPVSSALHTWLGWSIAVAGLLSAQIGAFGFWWWARPRSESYRIAVTADAVQVGAQRIPAEDIVACEVKGDALVFRLTRSRLTTTPDLGLNSVELEELLSTIRPLILTSEQRRDRARQHMEMLRGRQGLVGRAGQ
jgi:hypothetical protein